MSGWEKNQVVDLGWQHVRKPSCRSDEQKVENECWAGVVLPGPVGVWPVNGSAAEWERKRGEAQGFDLGAAERECDASVTGCVAAMR